LAAPADFAARPPMGDGKGRFLVRHRDIDALEAGARDAIDHRGKVFALGRQGHHRAVDAIFGQPMAMQHRRQRMVTGQPMIPASFAFPTCS
jgi:hypothetical protein